MSNTLPEGVPLRPLKGVLNESRCYALVTREDKLVWKAASIRGVGPDGYLVFCDNTPHQGEWVQHLGSVIPVPE